MSIPTEECCRAKVWPAGEWHQHRCERRAVRDGFCKQHHPDAEKARAEKSRQRMQDEWERSPAHQLQIARGRISKLEAEAGQALSGELIDTAEVALDLLGQAEAALAEEQERRCATCGDVNREARAEEGNGDE